MRHEKAWDWSRIDKLVDRQRRGIIFENVQAVAKSQNLTIIVKGTNVGGEDYYGIVTATFLDSEDKPISTKTKKESIEEDTSSKSIKINFTGLSKEAIASVKKYKLELFVEID